MGFGVIHTLNAAQLPSLGAAVCGERQGSDGRRYFRGRMCLWSLGVTKNEDRAGTGVRKGQEQEGSGLPCQDGFHPSQGELFFCARANLENLENKVSSSRQTTSGWTEEDDDLVEPIRAHGGRPEGVPTLPLQLGGWELWPC